MLTPSNHLAPSPAPTPILTARQREIVDLVCRAKSNKAIAHELGIAEPTVKGNLTVIFFRLGVESRTELILRVLSGGAR